MNAIRTAAFKDPRETLNKWTQWITVRPAPVEGLIQRFPSVKPPLRARFCLLALVPFRVGPALAQAAPVAEPGFDPGFLLHSVLVLGLVLALAVGGLHFLRRWGNLQTSRLGRLQILDGISLNHNERLLLVRVDRHQVLIGIAPGRITSLLQLGETRPGEVQAPGEVQTEEPQALAHGAGPIGGGFRQLLRRELGARAPASSKSAGLTGQQPAPGAPERIP